MNIDSRISIGNIVSWALIAMALATGYAKLESSTAQNAKDVSAATQLANRVEQAQREVDSLRQAQISTLTVDVAVVKSTTANIEKNLDEFIRFSKGR